MSTVVGLVKSRLRSKSRRGKSFDGVDVIGNDGRGLIRYRSLRQQALADPVDDDVGLSPTTAHPRTPNELDPAFLAEGLQSHPTTLGAPPVPPLPSEIPSEYFPARQSSLENRRSYSIKAHRRTSSVTQDGGRAMSGSSENQPKRRHYTISSPAERPQVTGADYFAPFSQSPASEEPAQPSHEGAEAKPATLTAKLYGTIAQKRRSTELVQEQSQPSSSPRSREMSQNPEDGDAARRTQSRSFSLSYRPRAATSDRPPSSMPADVERPAPLRLPKSKKPKIPEHVLLPEGFELINDERTAVDTVWHPTVEQQTIKREITEVLHPVIERDIHVQHYYEYEQPIQVMEVLAPNHYRIDPETGEKVKIQSPVGWEMPQPLTVQSPDISQIRGTQRHYVVNDKHPAGKLENWPLTEPEGVTTWI